LCQIDAAADLFGIQAEKVWFVSRICGFEPGTHSGLTVGYCAARKQNAYLIALDTAEKALTNFLGPFASYL
jgi:hypothetical protein